MANFDILIQKTTAGLAVEYYTKGIDPNDPEIDGTISDEREYSTQLGKNSDVYSFQVTRNYRVYSLIVTIVDVFDRLGFYEIKLYAPLNAPVAGFIEILQHVKSQYLNAEGKTNLDFSEILSSIPINEEIDARNYSYISKNSKDLYYYFKKPKELAELTLRKNLLLAKKVYGLRDGKAAPKEVAEALGLSPLDENNIKDVQILNPDRVLSAIYVNDSKLDFYPNSNELNLLLLEGDTVAYTTSDGKSKKSVPGNTITVRRKYVASIPTQSSRVKKSSGGIQNTLTYILLLIIMGGAGYYGYNRFLPAANDIDDRVSKTSNKTPTEKTSKFFKFYKQDNRYATKELNTIVFIYKDSSWYYGTVEQAVLTPSSNLEESQISMDNTEPIDEGKGMKQNDSIASPEETKPLTQKLIGTLISPKKEAEKLIKSLEGKSGKPFKKIEEEAESVKEVKTKNEEKKPVTTNVGSASPGKISVNPKGEKELKNPDDVVNISIE